MALNLARLWPQIDADVKQLRLSLVEERSEKQHAGIYRIRQKVTPSQLHQYSAR